MKPTPSLPVIGVMLAALAVIAVASWVAWSWIATGDDTGKASGGPMRTEADIGGPFALTDHHGRPVTDESFRGQYLLVYFGYGFCPDVCPTELSNMAAALDILGPKADKVVPVFITVDPERDTPEFLADYVVNFHPRLIGLTGTTETIAAVAKAYKVYYAKSRKSANSEDYLMDHTSFVYLMGPDGKFRTVFRPQTDPKKMAETIEGLMSESAAAATQSLQSRNSGQILPAGG
jgi:cytochrome oxidase Cu insertion factor (SCO1/SenC/PrrC family)